PGTAIDAKRYNSWLTRFGSYRAVNHDMVSSWLNQFQRRDRDLAARVLDAIDFYDQSQMHAAFQTALKSLPGWHKEAAKRSGKWRFAAMSGSAGESGDAMLYHFRFANKLNLKEFNPLFVTRSELFRLPMLPDDDPQRLGEQDVVVLLDDFSGTGTQI